MFGFAPLHYLTSSKSLNSVSSPAADTNLLKVPSNLSDEQVLFLSDIYPTAWHANELGQVGEGDKVAIWGAGPGKPLPAEAT